MDNSKKNMYDTSNLDVQKVSKVANKNPAAIQLTAEQLLREAQANQSTSFDSLAHIQQITDPDELEDYKYRMRKSFEDSIRRQVHHMGNWMKYAEWESNLKEYRRARSVYERALEVDYQNVTLWLRYAEMEMNCKFVNHARNVWERAIELMPGVDQFWLKYAYMEEVLSNYEKVREIFESWMSWKPRDTAWMAYLKFEERMGDVQKCRDILERFIDCQPDFGDQEAIPAIDRYLKAAKFEERYNERERARLIYERALVELGEGALKEEFFLAFCRFEIKCKEFARARVLFKYALDRIPKGKATRLYNEFVKFEKQFGSCEEMEEVVINKRRNFYQEEVEKEPYNYDAWFDYIRLEESTKDIDRIREVYEKAISNEPPGQHKKHWERYIYLWIFYALFEEQIAGSPERASQVYSTILSLIPHNMFSFSKLWILYAHFHVRQLDIAKARKIFGQAIAKCPKNKIFEAYIEMEKNITNFDSCRKIYEKWIEVRPNSSKAWISFANFEVEMEEYDRVSFVYNLAIENDLDIPEAVWKSYIDFEIEIKEFDQARRLFRQLLDQANHVKVWISFAKFEIENANDYDKSKAVYQEAYDYLKNDPDLKEERLMLLESWLKMEKNHGDEQGYEYVNKKMPKRVKKRRKIKVIYNNQQDGDQNKEDEGGWEEYYDYIFPDDEDQKRNLKIIEMAHKWKQKKQD